MGANDKFSFVLSALLHVLIAAFLLLISIWKPAEKKKEPVVMKIHVAPSSFAPEPALENVAFDYQEPEPVPTPAPPPPLPPKPEPQPKPEPKPPPKPESKPEPAPKPEPPPPPPEPAPPPVERVSYDDFRNKNPIRETPPRTPPPPRQQPISSPRIDTSQITRNLQSMMSQETVEIVSRQSPDDQAALLAYFDRIKASLRGAWAKPVGLNDRLQVAVSFQVSPNGRISSVRISSSSGNSIFDQSVLAAFERAGSVGSTPDGRSYPLRLEFQMTD